MKHLEIRRHTMRHKPGKHLTQAGVTLARHVGAGMGPFAKVITSDAPRAFETAIAMGFAVDEQLADLAQLGDEKVTALLEHVQTFADVAQAARRHKVVARRAQKLARLWTEIAQALPEAGAALIVTHGGVIELGVAGCLPDHDFSAWGALCDYCEGVRLDFDGRAFIRAEPLRVVKVEGS
ncbi:MAG: histidine phosphatase family protein [Anaerolineae bacterium]